MDGVKKVKDGCGCCQICARQYGDYCDYKYVCDEEKHLYCDNEERREVRGRCKGEFDKEVYMNSKLFPIAKWIIYEKKSIKMKITFCY